MGQRHFDLRIYGFALYPGGIQAVIGIQADQSLEPTFCRAGKSRSPLGFQDHHTQVSRKNEGSDPFVGIL